MSDFTIILFTTILTHLIRTVYEILKYRKIIKPNKVSFIIIFIDMVALWTSWFKLCSVESSGSLFTNFFSIFGAVLILAGLLIFLTALINIKTLESYNGELIKNGIYSIFSHPMYFSFILWLIGAPFLFGANLSFILSYAYIANVLVWRYFEEKELELRFENYIEYKNTTYF